MPLVQWTDIRSKHYRSTVEYLASLKKVRKMDLRVALPGHGQIIQEPSRKIDSLLGLIDARRKAVLAVLKKGSHTPVEIAREIFPHLPLEALFRAVSDVMGHLEMLEMEGFAREPTNIRSAFGPISLKKANKLIAPSSLHNRISVSSRAAPMKRRN